MAGNSGSKDKALEGLDFIINALKIREQNWDKLIDELATVSEQIADTINGLKSKVEESEKKLNGLQKDVANLSGSLSNVHQEDSVAAIKEQEVQTQVSAAQAILPAFVLGGPSVILRCKEWADFQALAVNAQKFAFNYQEAEKVFHANALRGNQLIIYSGELPNLSLILKTWLSRLLDMPEQNILEGSLGKPK